MITKLIIFHKKISVKKKVNMSCKN